MEEGIVDEDKFLEHYEKQVQGKSQRDVFFIWVLIIIISVIAAHFVLNITGSSPTGFVTAAQDTPANMTILMAAILVVFIVVLITALIHIEITKKDH